jgi:hypothetical protein
MAWYLLNIYYEIPHYYWQKAKGGVLSIRMAT